MSFVSLRTTSEIDKNFLCRVYTSTRLEELAVTGWSDADKAIFCESQFTAQDAHYRLHYPKAEYSIILSQNTETGRLYVDRWPQEIRIMDIALLPEFRGQGIGSHLLQQLQQESTTSQKLLSIHVERMNPALRLYERLGFRVAEDKGIYLLMHWQPPGLEGASGEDGLKQ